MHPARFIDGGLLIPTKNKSRVTIHLLSLLFVLLMVGCQHQSKIQPSSGHIKNNDEITPAVQQSLEVARPNKPVLNLPIPKSKIKEPTYSVVVNEVPVKEILFALARDSKLNVDISPSISGNVTLNAVDQTLPAILERLSRQVNLIYRVENSVLVIEPDNPELRNYQINYVNIERTTKSGVSVTNEIASTNAENSPQGTARTIAGDKVPSNSSSTSVYSESRNDFWASLIQNIKDILSESDKEVLVRRLGSDTRLQAHFDVEARGTGSANSNSRGAQVINDVKGVVVAGGGVSGAGNENVKGGNAEKSEENLKEYKTLFAASVIANKETGVLSVRANQRQHKAVRDFIDKVQTGARRQVLIEASIVEITLNDHYQAGIDWSRLGPGGEFNGFTFQQDLISSTGFNSPASFSLGYKKSTVLGDLNASVKMLQTFGDSKVLSSPKLMVLNSQTAILKVVDNLIYFTVTAKLTPSSTPGGAPITTYTTTPQTIPTGVWLSVTPQINENDEVTLNVRPTIARQIGLGKQDPNPTLAELKIESRIPQIQVREMESMLQVSSGNIVVLGGLMQDEVTRTNSGVPGAMAIEKLGLLFSAKSDSIKKTELVIFLKPTVIKKPSLNSDELEIFKQYLPENQLKKLIDEAAEQTIK